MECVFCKILDGKIPSHAIWSDDKFFAFLDINPVSPGHTLLIPKKHHDYFFDMDDATYTEIIKAAKKLSKPLQKAMNAKRIGVLIEGFAVPHTHIHLIPINKGGEMDPNRAKKASQDELSGIAKKIKDALSD